MKRFDYFRYRDSNQYLLVLQSERLGNLDTRMVASLLPSTMLKTPVPKLNPIFEINGEEYVMMTAMMAAVSLDELRVFCGSLAYAHHIIVDAIDMLFEGI